MLDRIERCISSRRLNKIESTAEQADQTLRSLTAQYKKGELTIEEYRKNAEGLGRINLRRLASMINRFKPR